MAQIAACEIDVGSDLRATRRDCDDRALAFKQAFWPIFRVIERDAGAGDQVDPCFQRRRNTEIVDRCADQERICGFKFGNELVRQCENILIGVGPFFFGCPVGGEPYLVNGR